MRDLTYWIVVASVDIVNSPEMQNIKTLNNTGGDGGIGRNVAAYWDFKGLVGDGMKFDVKDEIKGQLGLKTKIGDQWFEYSTAGNMVYGFYGKAVGFSETELRAGAGYAQWADHRRDPKNEMGPCNTQYYCDTEDDYAAVGFGMFLYDDYYKPDSLLTEADLLDALKNYKDTNKMNIVAPPRNFIPQDSYYPANQFYHKAVAQ